jgi:hypothetical protein
MSLKIATLCPTTSLEMLQPLCYHGTHSLQRNLCHCFHEEYLQAVQVVMALSASHVLQNSPQFIVQRVEVQTPRRPILSTDKCCNVPHSHSWVILALVAHRLHTLGHQLSHLSHKNDEVWPPRWDNPHQTMTIVSSRLDKLQTLHCFL